jgi:hypothetical protein
VPTIAEPLFCKRTPEIDIVSGGPLDLFDISAPLLAKDQHNNKSPYKKQHLTKVVVSMALGSPPIFIAQKGLAAWDFAPPHFEVAFILCP